MQNGSSHWKDEKVSIDKLNLDLQNPRLPKHVKEHNDENLVRNYLLDKENVIEIAESISLIGYHRSAVAIVCEEDGKLVVLDGNRRLAACQLIVNPSLAPSAKIKQRFENFAKSIDMRIFDEIKITIAPNRKAAEQEIWDIHVKELLRPWQKLQKTRMYRNAIDSGDYKDVSEVANAHNILESDVKNSLAELFFFELIVENVDPKGEEELLSSGFNKIERIIMSTNGRKLLDFSIDQKGNVTSANKTQFDENFKKTIPFIIDRTKVDAQADQQTLIETVYSEIDPVLFPKKKISKAKSKKLKSKKSKKKKGSAVLPNWITEDEYRNYSGARKVKNMLNEMSQLPPQDNENILNISLRVLLETCLYYKLEDKGYIKKMITQYKADLKVRNTKNASSGKPIEIEKKNWSPTFREMLIYILDSANGVVADPQARAALEKLVKGNTNMIEDLNHIIHNVHFAPSKGDAEKNWSVLGRLLFEITDKIT